MTLEVSFALQRIAVAGSPLYADSRAWWGRYGHVDEHEDDFESAGLDIVEYSDRFTDCTMASETFSLPSLFGVIVAYNIMWSV